MDLTNESVDELQCDMGPSPGPASQISDLGLVADFEIEWPKLAVVECMSLSPDLQASELTEFSISWMLMNQVELLWAFAVFMLSFIFFVVARRKKDPENQSAEL
jgi:hypothetical protein